MFMKNRMTTEAITLSPDQTLLKAMNIIQQKRIRHLPVVQEGKVDENKLKDFLRTVGPPIISVR